MTEKGFMILAAVAPAIVLAMIMIRKDKQRPEPIGWLLLAVLSGVLIGPVILLLAYIGIIPNIPGDTFMGALLTSFLSAAIPEEGLKFLALFLLAKMCRHFDEIFDGIVYAVCIGMGFAGLENIMYLFDADDWVVLGISRALLSVPAHYAFAVIMGTFFSLGWFDKRNRKVYMTGALILPIIVHGLYDTLCFSMGLNEDLSLTILLLFILGFRYIRRYVKTLTTNMIRLDEETMRGQ